jgi:HPt (histidine-containing phosphotransfer) domain-containing protein
MARRRAAADDSDALDGMPDLTDEPIVDDDVARRLLSLRDQVAKAGEDVLGDLCRLFERDGGDRLVSLRKAVRDADHDALSRTAHALKGSAANMGVRRVVAIAQLIEKNAPRVDDACLDALKAAFDEAIGELKRRLGVP